MPLTSTLNEFVLATHFQAALPLTVVDLADWISAFRTDFSEVQELPVASRAELAPLPALVQLNFGPVILPRIVLRAPEKHLTVQLQADRFAFGWARAEPIGEPANYPGYESMKAQWLEMVERFRSWHEKRLGGQPSSRMIEIAYHNASPMRVGDHHKRISEVFRFVQPARRRVQLFQVTWQEQLSESADAPRVVAQVALGTAPPAQEVFAFNFTGLAQAPGSAVSPEAVGNLDALHGYILDMHKASIISDAE